MSSTTSIAAWTTCGLLLAGLVTPWAVLVSVLGVLGTAVRITDDSAPGDQSREA
jgi:hypothetical protein